MKIKPFYILFLLSFIGYSQTKTDIIISILGEHNGYYNRDILTNPLKQTDVQQNLNEIITDKDYINLIKNLSDEQVNSDLSDTLNIQKCNLKYSKGAVRYNIRHSKYAFYNKIVINSKNLDTLNGLTKISSLQNKAYQLGYFFKGSPYLLYHNNIFEFYKKKKLYKRRYFVHSIPNSFPFIAGEYLYNKFSIIEDYYPLTKTKWRREIKTWPSEELLVEDTVVYRKNKGYIDGLQKIYKIESYTTYKPDTIRTERLLLKTHRYKKGHIQSVSEYSYYPSYQNFVIQQIKKLNISKRGNMTAEIQKYDIFGRLLYHGAYKNVPLDKSDKNGCPNGVYKFDKYYTGIEPDEQCFQPIGKHYELKPYYDYSNGKRIAILDSLAEEYYGYFKKGVLVKYSMKGLYPVTKIKDSVTQKIYGNSLSVYENQVTDYKKRLSIIEYLSYPDKKLILRIIKNYKKCIGGFAMRSGWYEAYCEDESLSSKYDDQHETNKLLEYYNPSGKKIIDEEFTGKYEDFLNNYYKN